LCWWPTLARMSGEKMKLSRWRLPLVVGSVVVLAGAIAVGAGVLIAHGQKPHTSPAAYASSAVSPSPSGVARPDDPHGQKACELNEEARDADTLSNDAVILRILREAQQSPNQDVQFDAQMLVDRQTLSNHEIARGGNDLELVLGGRNASLDMGTHCIKNGYLYR
jgi:hypothetical protein